MQLINAIPAPKLNPNLKKKKKVFGFSYFYFKKKLTLPLLGLFKCPHNGKIGRSFYP